MILLILTMVLVLVLATAVTAYVAFPRRGVDLPLAPGLGHALERRVQNLPTLGRVER